MASALEGSRAGRQDNTRVWGQVVEMEQSGRTGNSQGEAEGLGLMQGLERHLRTGFHAASHQGIISELRVER